MIWNGAERTMSLDCGADSGLCRGPIVNISELRVNAFVEAGAQTVVSTLWELEDHATAHLMTVFYEHLARAEGKGQSLRESQLQMIASGDPPYFWAGFEIVGDSTGTLFDKPNVNSTMRRTQ